MLDQFGRGGKSKETLKMSSDDYTTENKAVIAKYKHDNILREDYFKNSSKVNVPITGTFPLKIDNRQLCTPTEYQGDKPYCVGYSAAQLLEAMLWKYTGKLVNMDAAQIYAKAKEKDGKISVGGTFVDLGLTCAVNICPEKIIKNWFMVRTSRERDPRVLKRILHMNDLCMAGFNITEGWYEVNASNGYTIQQKIPKIGGHAVLVCGYDENGVYIQNHWGRDWGAKGFAILPWKLYEAEFMQLCWLECKQ